jgi:hypothetical protein
MRCDAERIALVSAAAAFVAGTMMLIAALEPAEAGKKDISIRGTASTVRDHGTGSHGTTTVTPGASGSPTPSTSTTTDCSGGYHGTPRRCVTIRDHRPKTDGKGPSGGTGGGPPKKPG